MVPHTLEELFNMCQSFNVINHCDDADDCCKLLLLPEESTTQDKNKKKAVMEIHKFLLVLSPNAAELS